MLNNENLSGLGFLLSDVSRLMRRRFAQKAQAYGLTAPQWRALAQLKRCGEVNQAELSGLLESEPMTVSRLVERLELSGLIERISDPADRRAKLVRLTTKSRTIFDDIGEIANEVYQEALEGLSDEERLVLMSTLKRMNANLLEQFSSVKEEQFT
jgi:DNA-binding MarR family transcriptional regulator